MTWLVVLPCLAVVTALGVRHNAVFKSIHQANLECQRYLNGTNNETCGSRCELLVLRGWSDETGLVCDSYQRYFRPTCDDTDFKNRTRSCIASGWSTAGDVCDCAEVAARCCREQYGFLESRSPKILRMPEVLVTSSLMQCARILGVAAEELRLYRGVWFQFPEKARRLLRCLVLRQGIFADDHGLDVDGAFFQYEHSIEKEELEGSFGRCANRVLAKQYKDRSRWVARTMFQCIPRNVSFKIDSVDLIPTKLHPVECMKVFKSKCQEGCSRETIAEQCHDPAFKISTDLLNDLLQQLEVSEEGLLLPSITLIDLLPKVIDECVSTRLNDCLEDCSHQGIQVICSPP
ncbi:general odorant-binding protein 45-like [Culex pipiens pallens]|uniref:general odorant-binding protein 45-like n=1 Tax=Culex pipiens pallens TaxID=42434 RepID=UPI0019538327|nr:general odorant-binding protein 45-like [Culex pipiens pallens]